MPPLAASPPRIAIACDTSNGRASCPAAYLRAVACSGAQAVLLACVDEPAAPVLAAEHAADPAFDGFLLIGGDDPRTEPFGTPTHPASRPVDPARQAYETALLRALASRRPDTPVFGVCLGMQMMALVAGGELNQHMPDDTPTALSHLSEPGDTQHPIAPSPNAPACLTAGPVASRHRQSVRMPGSLSVSATAPDGVIEAVHDPAKRFYLGVQWHPERTHSPLRSDASTLGQGLFDAFAAACAAPSEPEPNPIA